MSSPIGRTGLARISSAVASSLSSIGDGSRSVLFDDFLGDVLADQWNYVEGTDSATADGAVLASAPGGILRLTTGDAGTGLAADLCQVTSYLNWRAANGDLVMEARVKPSAITTCYMFFGFTDVGTLEAPVESAASVDTLTSNATDAVGIMFDTRMATDHWFGVGVKNDVDATHQDLGSAPVAAQYVTLRVQVTKTGVAMFFINGSQVGTEMAAAVTPATVLTPTIAVGKTSVAAAMQLDCDYIAVNMQRGANGASV